jgi:polar amino acid transport system substrate-binding protein
MIKLWLAVGLCMAAALSHGADKVRLGYSDVENFPYQAGNGVTIGEQPGTAIELLRMAAHDLGIELEFVRMPAMRLLVAMQSNDIDGSFIFSYKDDRLQYGSYPMRDGKPDRARRITTINYSFYKASQSNVHWNGTQLVNSTMPVGINTGFSIGDDLKKMGMTIDDGAKATGQNISKLQRGRISAYATLEDSADAYLLRFGITDVVKLTPPIVSRDYYLMLSKRFTEQHGELAERIWTRVGALRDKRTPEIMEKYLN